MKMIRALTSTSCLLLAALAPALAGAQDAPADEAPPPAGNASASDASGGGTKVTVVQVPSAPAQAPQVIVPGYPQPGYDVNGHLPSSSRARVDTSQPDGFDLAPDAARSETMHGNENGGYVVEGQMVPEQHTVRPGDTLWDISSRYYKNPYGWPRLWAQNPQIQNPHWIYPGDQVILRDGSDPTGPASLQYRLVRGSRVPPQTIFLRDVGWLDDKDKDTWGEVVGSPEDKMMLSEGDDVYIQLGKDPDGKDREVAAGQTLTIFRPLRTTGDAAQKGTLVSIRGTLRVDRVNSQTHMVRAHIVESLDVIERGAKIGPLDRRFDVVPPSTSSQDLEAKIIAALYPHAFYGQNQVVFLDKGEKEGVKPGMRFFGVRRGDRWRRSLRGAGPSVTLRPVIEDDRPAQTESMPPGGDEEQFPDETYAEIRVLRVREHTATALVTASSHEIERGALVISRKGL
jgi:LysM repeat protein